MSYPLPLVLDVSNEMADDVLALAGEHVDDGQLNHGVAAGLLTHGGTGHVNEYLGGQGGVVNLHVELEELVVGLSTDTLAHEVDAVADIVEGVHAFHLKDVGLV